MKVLPLNYKAALMYFVCLFVLTELVPPELQYTHLGYVYIFPTSASNKIFWYFSCKEDQISEGKSSPSGNTDYKFLGFLPTNVQGNEPLT